MSQENSERLRRFWEMWMAGSTDMSILDPAVEYEDTSIPDHVGETYHGHDGVLRATERWFGAYESVVIELDRIVGTGDRLVSVHHVRMKGLHTGIEIEGPLAYLFTFRNGKVIHFRSYWDVDTALEAVGLSE
jgi:ketosteroid isomerase-like protein